MNILIINAGSSSIKYQLIQMPSELIIGKGLIERIGSKNATVKYKTNTVDIEEVMLIPNHSAGFQKMATLLMDPDKGVIANVNDIGIVAHRVVHGGNSFSETTAITQEAFPKAKQIAVFDTAFHQTMPVKAKKYALPNEFYTDHGIQAYGFHGTSHKYVSEKAISFLKLKSSKIITIHLGHGCSITAVRDGKSLDHSMGFTPANGLIMGSRSGDIDHSLIFYLVNNLGYGLEEVNALLSKKSGMLGLTGHRDLRDIEAKAKTGNKECILALEMNAYRIKKYIGAYAAAMNGLDAVVFSAGIGENSSTLRNLVCTDMDYLGITLDPAKNESKSSNIREIGSTNAKVKILVVPTNEELEIAKQAFGLSQNQ